jgi:hypothetical protein
VPDRRCLNRIYFALLQDEVTHHDLHAALPFGHCYPSTEAESGWRRYAIDRYLEIASMSCSSKTTSSKEIA